MSFSHYPRESCIHLIDLEEEADINVKCGMVTIPAGTPRIITTNREAPEIFSSYDRAIKRRLTVATIEKDLRKLKQVLAAGQCYIPADFDEND